MAAPVRKLSHAAADFWQAIRAWCGDDAYETYRRCAARRKDKKVLSPTEFYVEQLERRYSRPSRCC